MSEHQFAIRKVVLKNGTEIYTPLTRKRNRFIKNPWVRITSLENKLILQDIDFDVPLTQPDCLQRIERYKQELNDSRKATILTIKDEMLPSIKL